MSTAAKQKAKAAGIRLDDDFADGPAEPVVPRTAPGQLIGLQGRVHSQQAEIDRLKRALEQRAPGKLPLDKLHEIPGRRRRLTPAEYAELKANLTAYPLAQPITVCARADGEYDIVAGHNRAAVYRELGKTEIDGIVLDIDSSMVEYARILLESTVAHPFGLREVLGIQIASGFDRHHERGVSEGGGD